MTGSRWLAVKRLFWASALFATVVGFGATVSAQQPGGVVTVAMAADQSNLNPIFQNTTVIWAVYSPLLALDQQLDLHPELATDWAVSDDGLTYTFNLRDGVTWHDGAPFTAEDVVFTFEAILNPDVPTGRRAQFTQIANVTALDDSTVEFTLGAPFAPFLTAIADQRIAPAHLLGEEPDLARAQLNRTPVGTGPFRFVEWVPGSHIILERNDAFYFQSSDNHYRGVPYVDRYVLRIIPDENARMVAVRVGDIDVYSQTMSGAEWRTVQGFSGVSAIESDGRFYGYLGLNLRNPLFADRSVRQAIAYGINRDGLLGAAFAGNAVGISTNVLPWSWAYDPDVPQYEYDPGRARDLLAEAGWELGDDGILHRDGARFEFTLIASSTNRERLLAAQVVQFNLQALGMDVRLQSMEHAVLRQRRNALEFDAIVDNDGVGYDPDLFSHWHSSQIAPDGANWVGFANPALDSLLERQQSEADRSTRVSLFSEIQHLIVDEVPVVFLYYPKFGSAVRDRVQGVDADGPLFITWNLDKWWLDGE